MGERPLRVLYVLRYWPTVSETFVAREIAALQARGVEVVVLSMGWRADRALATGLPGVETWHWPRGRARLRATLRHPRWNRDRVRLAWARARGNGRFDRVHAHFAGEAAEVARALARSWSVPYSVTVHAVDLFRPRPGLPHLLADARPCVTVCAHHADWIARHYGVDARVVRCGVPLAERVARPEREPARVVCVARPVEKKGLDRLRRAVAASRLDLVGADGPVSPDQVENHLVRAQVFALPCQVATTGDRDGVPVSMMEAMAVGLPVVSRPIAGIPELVDDEVGWVDLDFERALSAALSDPGARRARGAAARTRVREHWTLEGQARALLEAWCRVRP
jgi:glycosyltransferase involved in cell wall biosynthesis